VKVRAEKERYRWQDGNGVVGRRSGQNLIIRVKHEEIKREEKKY
jgi:hypothetical protein